VVRLQAEHSGGKKITNAIQTNGTLLDDEWCSFLAEAGFLVGLSVDGPEELHDANRVDKGGKPSFKKVMRGLDLMKRHGTEFNTLTVVNRLNSMEPEAVYRFLKGIGSQFLQFIPLVEREADPVAKARKLELAGPPGGGETSESGPGSEVPPVTSWSVEPEAFGGFLMGVFDEWLKEDVGRVFVQLFDTTLAGWMGAQPPLCVFAETCGDALVLEHNGDLYSCDHYVYPEFKVGNIMEDALADLATSSRQMEFGQAKRDTLPEYCLRCEVRFLCNGECPKHRFIETPDGEPGLNYLCQGYKRFFTETTPAFQLMAELLKRGRPPAEVMGIMAERRRSEALAAAGRNDPCPCGSGKKFKNCCGKPM
jgi:uncharacterized protein